MFPFRLQKLFFYLYSNKYPYLPLNFIFLKVNVLTFSEMQVTALLNLKTEVWVLWQLDESSDNNS